MNYLELNLIGDNLGGIIAFILFISTLFIRFVDHKSVIKCLKFTFLQNQRAKMQTELKDQYGSDFEKQKAKPAKPEV